MPLKIDAHLHIVPDYIGPYADEVRHQVAKHFGKYLSPKWELPEWSGLKAIAQFGLRPYFKNMQLLQPMVRHLPAAGRVWAERFGFVLGMPALLLEGSKDDLVAAIEKNSLDAVVLIAWPPQVSNERVLEISRDDPRVIPVVMIPKTVDKPDVRLREYVEMGAKALKIHPAVDDLDPECAHYQSLLSTAQELKLAVILHTGCVHVPFIYENPDRAKVENFEPWFKAYPDLVIILAHMNLHDPILALELAEKYPQLMVETSWQPEEMIHQAVKRLGAHRVMFGSDWPLLGATMEVALERLQKNLEFGWISQAEMALVAGENAAKVFKFSSHPG